MLAPPSSFTDVLNRDAAASDAVGALARRVVVQRQCRANRHGARVSSGARNRAGCGDVEEIVPEFADEARR